MPPAPDTTSTKEEKLQKIEEGVFLEGYEKGGIIEIHRRDEVKFFRDIAEYFIPSLIIIGGHAIYYLTGNIMIPLFLGQSKIILTHFLSGEVYQDKKNLSRKSEKVWMNDYRFHYPLWTCVFLETLTWIWALVLTSDKVEFKNHYLSAVKPKNTAQYIILSGVVGFFLSMTVSAGHELIHKRDRLNKTIGTFVFTKFFYSHFMDEHVQGHHRQLGTPADANTARKDEGIWHFILREIYMGQVSSWQREFRRIRKKYGE